MNAASTGRSRAWMEARPPAQPDTIPVHPHPEGVSPLQWTPLLGAGSRVLGRCTGWQDVTILEKISQPLQEPVGLRARQGHTSVNVESRELKRFKRSWLSVSSEFRHCLPSPRTKCSWLRNPAVVSGLLLQNSPQSLNRRTGQLFLKSRPISLQIPRI